MPLLQATLYDELYDKVDLFSDPALAMEGWATAFDNYWINAVTNGIPVIPGSTIAAKTAMQGSLVSLNVPGLGATAITLGITTYWATLNLAPPAVFALCTAIVPPTGLTTLQAVLDAAFLANIAAKNTKEVALNVVATIIHMAQIAPIPGQSTFPGPLNFPIL